MSLLFTSVSDGIGSKTFAGAKVQQIFDICKLFAKKSAIIIKEGTGCPIKSGVMDIKRDSIPQ